MSNFDKQQRPVGHEDVISVRHSKRIYSSIAGLYIS